MKTNKSHLLLISFTLLVMFLSTSSLAPNSCVSAAGSDSNSGTAPQQAWKTLASVNDLFPKAGDSILFRRGDQWSGAITVNMFGKNCTPILFRAYGEGAKSELYGSEKITG